MTRYFKTLCAASVIACFGSFASAKENLYICTMTKGAGETSWISDTVALVFNDNGSVQVLDGLIMHYFKEALPAKVRKSGDTLHINWLIKGIDDSVGVRIPRVRYSAKFNQTTKDIRISSRIPGFENVDYAVGSCVIGKK